MGNQSSTLATKPYIRQRSTQPLADGASTRPEPDVNGVSVETASNGVSVIIPAYNEENAIADQVKDVDQVMAATGLPYEIIIVDDGSRDRTAQEAIKTGVRVLQHVHNRGYGASLKNGIVAAHYEQIVIIDADGTYPSDQIPALLAELQHADMVVGARIGNEVHIPLVRRPAKWVLRWLAAYIADRRIPDLNSGLRVFRRDCIMQYFPILSNRFSFTTTSTLALLADDYEVIYHPINYYQRIGKSKITPRHFMDFIILVLRMSMMFQPLRIFIPLAFACGTLGTLKVVYDILTYFVRHGALDWTLLYQPVLSTSAVLLLFVGFQVLMLGMVADGVVRKIAQHSRPSVSSHTIGCVELTDAEPAITER